MTTPKSILLVLVKDNEAKIKEAIISLAGFAPMEKITAYKYTLKLGVVDPIIIGYDLLPNFRPEEKIRRSSLIAMLREICVLMEDPGKFIIWTTKNKTFINKQN